MSRKTKKPARKSEANESAASMSVADMRQVSVMLVFSVGALIALGLLMLYSASMTEAGHRMLVKQSQWLSAFCLHRGHVVGLSTVAQILMGDSGDRHLALCPGFDSGHRSQDRRRRRWFKLRIISTVRTRPDRDLIWIAFYCEWQTRNIKNFKRESSFPVSLWASACLILVEPDRGTFILMSAVCAGILFVAGVRFHYLAVPVVLGAVGIAYLLWVDPVRSARILSWLNPEEYRMTTGYQNWQALIALGNGGIFGVGLGDGRQKLGFVPEHHTDFIYSVIGEELGLVATISVIIAFAVIAYCGITIAWKSRDRFGYYLATGITLLVTTQAIVNIGVVTAVFPNKGMSLPFISYGGSNLMAMMACLACCSCGTPGNGRRGDPRRGIGGHGLHGGGGNAMNEKPLIAIACGGTGGHLFPGMTIGREFVRRGCDVTLLVSPKEVDQLAVRCVTDMEVVTLPSVALQGATI